MENAYSGVEQNTVGQAPIIQGFWRAKKNTHKRKSQFGLHAENAKLAYWQGRQFTSFLVLFLGHFISRPWALVHSVSLRNIFGHREAVETGLLWLLVLSEREGRTEEFGLHQNFFYRQHSYWNLLKNSIERQSQPIMRPNSIIVQY